uniref:Adhesion G protein-coupled receptor E8 n=1 Tax=Haplochromis burtoni TaxID=8153 RepID=A0A3Q3CMB3_HAPBU
MSILLKFAAGLLLFFLSDIDECQRTTGICGPNSNCKNTIGSYICTCLNGFNFNLVTVVCLDIDECLANICGQYGSCTNTIGSYVCNCNEGFHIQSDATPNIYKRNRFNIDECADHVLNICGANCNCTNSIGSYNCTCLTGYRVDNPHVRANIDECSETPGLCGNQTVCTNAPGTFYCSCPDGFYPSTGVIWKAGITFCKNIDECLSGVCGPYGTCYNTIGSFVCNCSKGFRADYSMSPVCQDVDECYNSTICGPYSICQNLPGNYSCSCKVGFEPMDKTKQPNETNVCIDIDECTETPGICGKMTVCTNVPGTFYCSCPDGLFPTTGIVFKSDACKPECALLYIQIFVTKNNMLCDVLSKPQYILSNAFLSFLHNVILKIKYIDKSKLFLFNEWFSISFVMRKLPGSATAAFMTLNGMESLLSHQYFQTEKKTDMCSDVITTFNVSSLLFQEVPETGTVSCVYWKTTETVEGKSMSWSEEGCWVAFSNENYTICSCSHLSTFALIMQIGETLSFLHFIWLNRICVIIGLFFLALAIFTFLLCSWNPKINNTARLHLCLNLFFSQLLLLWNDKYTDNKLACTVMAGLLHFLIVASFVWMLLEALQLHLLVRKLSQVQVIRRDGLPRPILYLVGYGVPFVIVGVSALIYSDGYGVTSSNVCFLSTKRNFNWALTGPIIAVLINWLLFLATLWSLRPTLANMKSDVSQSKDTRLIIFKIVAQFVILGCTWILGLYQSNLFFQVLFIILNSQQGTFLYIVHCLLNKEVDLSLSYALITFCSFTTSHLNVHTRPIVTQ